MTLKELYKKMEHATPEQKEEACELLDEVFSKYLPRYYRDLCEKLHDIFKDAGEDLTEAEAKEYVARMVNKDGTHGAHWSLLQVKRLAERRPELKRYDCLAFYVVLNMMYSDYYHMGKSEEYYIMLAEDFLNDKDAPADKVRRYMEAMEK